VPQAKTTRRMNNEELLQTADAMRAFVEGKPIQLRLIGAKEWIDHATIPGEFPSWDVMNFLYRPKPQSKRVHWSKPEHVPGPVCWIKFGEKNTELLVVAIDVDGVRFDGAITTSWKSLAGSTHIPAALHSTDRVTWHACEAEEQ